MAAAAAGGSTAAHPSGLEKRRILLAAPPHALEPHGLHRVARPVVVVAHIRAVVIGDAPLRRHGGGPVRGPRSPGEKESGFRALRERERADDEKSCRRQRNKIQALAGILIHS